MATLIAVCGLAWHPCFMLWQIWLNLAKVFQQLAIGIQRHVNAETWRTTRQGFWHHGQWPPLLQRCNPSTPRRPVCAKSSTSVSQRRAIRICTHVLHAPKVTQPSTLLAREQRSLNVCLLSVYQRLKEFLTSRNKYFHRYITLEIWYDMLITTPYNPIWMMPGCQVPGGVRDPWNAWEGG